MLFNSSQFLIFFVIVYFMYLRLDLKWQNRMLLTASYVFYGSWNWKFLPLLLFSTLLNFILGVKVYESQNENARRYILGASIVCNLVPLVIFKYYNFFIDNLQYLLVAFGLDVYKLHLDIILPIGISFYTFQVMSYTIDIYRKEMKPTRELLEFALFVSFFPQLLAGPIERAKNLLPQLLKERTVDIEKIRDGAFLILLGLFLKVFVSDNLGKIVDPVFSSKAPYIGTQVLMAGYAFAFQLYCDFAGYSNIARGLAKLLGIEIMINFNAPYFSRNVQEYWERWHISLTSWIRDYLFIPLVINTRHLGRLGLYFSILLTWALVGLWHGASWKFVIFGIYYSILFIVLIKWRSLCQGIELKGMIIGMKYLNSAGVLVTFNLAVIGHIIFRAGSVKQILEMLTAITSDFHIYNGMLYDIKGFISLIWFVLAVDYLTYKSNGEVFINRINPFLGLNIILFIIYSIIFNGVMGEKQFIYFAF